MTQAAEPAQRAHWYAPRNPRLTPWYSLKGWLELAQHWLGWRFRKLSQHIDALHGRLPATPGEVPMPTTAQIAAARALVYKHHGGSETLSHIPEKIRALEVVACVACNVMHQRASRPQLLAAMAMAEGALIQLAPGEGKTLAVAMAAILLGWSGKPLHIVTANDYLAARDADLMAPLFAMCGLSVSAITQDTQPHELADRYRQSIVYATAKQFLADFLRDDLLLGSARDPVRRRLWHMSDASQEKTPVMRGLHTVIIDEADGALIDEAITPLIIASPAEDKSGMLDAIRQAHQLGDQLQTKTHYTVYKKGASAVHWTENGKQAIESLSKSLSGYWQVPTRREELFTLTIMAREVFQLDRHFIVKDGEVVIVDEGTGRSMPGRSWSHGIHQAIEAHVGVDLTPLTRISARMTFQEFFRHYHRLSGASGTMQGLDTELWKTFGLFILPLAPRATSRLRVLPKKTYSSRAAKLAGFIRTIEDLHLQNLPILVGTRRILDSEEIAGILRSKGLACDVLNAKEHELEAQVIANAGNFGCITVATNMAGRGTDILVPKDVEAQGGLQVLMFEAHESPRIDWQLFGRAGRQGAQGSAQAFVSLEEELIVKYTPAWLKPLANSLLVGLPTHYRLALLQSIAQRSANRIAVKQRANLAFMQKQLREQLGFAKG